MSEPTPVRIALVTLRAEDEATVSAALSEAPPSRFQVETITPQAAADAVGGRRHHVYLLDAGAAGLEADGGSAHTEGAAAVGCDLLEKAIAIGRPVIVLTDRDEAAGVQRALDAGAWDCLARTALTPAMLTHSLHLAVHHARRQAAEQERLRKRKMEAISRFAGGVAHDFNNLLTAMLGYAEMLRETLDASDPRRDDVAEIQRAGERATALTRQLLTFGLRLPTQLRPLDLNATLDRVAAILPPTLGDRVRLEVVRGENVPATRGDALQIELLLAHLARNASDAMPEGGRLRIETSNVEVDEETAGDWGCGAGRYALLRVSDTGTGMTPEVLSHVFEPFFTTKEKGKGTGLGLPVVYGIVRQSGGHLLIDSAQGRGTCVSIYLPATV